jgi:hypothetical protein
MSTFWISERSLSALVWLAYKSIPSLLYCITLGPVGTGDVTGEPAHGKTVNWALLMNAAL